MVVGGNMIQNGCWGLHGAEDYCYNPIRVLESGGG
jgi:hypothetical protein